MGFTDLVIAGLVNRVHGDVVIVWGRRVGELEGRVRVDVLRVFCWGRGKRERVAVIGTQSRPTLLSALIKGELEEGY